MLFADYEFGCHYGGVGSSQLIWKDAANQELVMISH